MGNNISAFRNYKHIWLSWDLNDESSLYEKKKESNERIPVE